MALKLITAASTYPVTLAEAKLHCKVDVADDDALLTALITTATEGAEQITGRALMAQTWELTLDAFPDAFELTRVPVQSVTSVKYFDATGVQQTLASNLYSFDNADDNNSAYVVPAYGTSWPVTREQINAVAVRYVSGYTTVPEPIKTWIKIQISEMYKNREASVIERATLMSLGYVDRLLDRYSVITA
ncbi:MAG: hypothetical protein CGW95_04820 [Phenylobacterium zucineum]|nr:MAG: hypothetical protein CGW95_04820 [Phenylobacterium zucineum]